MIRPATIRATLEEARGLWSQLEERPGGLRASVVGVSGMLAEQLAREVGRGAEAGAVVVHGPAAAALPGIAVHVIAGEPSEVDVGVVEEGDREGIPVVLVQLWPQADWAPPFVLTPFVVECRAGEGFPIEEIGSRIVEAAGEGAPALAARIPALRGPSSSRARREAVARAAFLGALGGRRRGTRAALTLEQARLLSRVERASPSAGTLDDSRRAGAAAAGLLAAGLALREVARVARRALPRPVADGVVAAGGTWALAEAYARLAERLGARLRG